MTSFYTHADRFSPILCRLLARRKNGPPLTTLEIAQRSGLSAFDVTAISMSKSWDDIPFAKMRSFLRAIEMDFCDSTAMNRKRMYLRSSNKFKYLQKSFEWETVLKPLALAYRQTIDR